MSGIVLLGLAQSVYASGTISGQIRFEPRSGETGAAEWTRIYIVRHEVPFPKNDIEHPLVIHNRQDRINLAYQKFYSNFQREAAKGNFLAATTLAATDGSFRFTDIDKGRYFIVVAFPSAIGGYKVTWQLEVSVTDNAISSVELNRENLLLPTFSRKNGGHIIEAGI